MKQVDKAQSAKTDYVSSFAERPFRYSANLSNSLAAQALIRLPYPIVYLLFVGHFHHQF